MIGISINKLFFKSFSIDPNSGHSIYVFDSTYLPDPAEIGDDKQVYDMLIDELMGTLIAKLPSSPFSLVIFSSGFTQKKISWVYGIKMFSKLPREAKYYLQKTYIVHESFFIRTVYQVLVKALNIKYLTQMNSDVSSVEENSFENGTQQVSIVHVPDLTALSQLIDIARLRISLNVYLYDYSIEDSVHVPQNYFDRLSDINRRKYRQLVFDKIFRKLTTYVVKTELIFQKPGSSKKVNIFLDLMERNNYVDISQWDIYSLGTIFLSFLKNKAKPLIPVDLIPLPIEDDIESTFRTFINIINYNNYYHLLITVFPLFISILKFPEETKHDSRSLSKVLAPALCHIKLSISNDDKLAIGTRFIKNLLENWDGILFKIDQLKKGSKARAPGASSEEAAKNDVTPNTATTITTISKLAAPLKPKKSASSPKLNRIESTSSESLTLAQTPQTSVPTLPKPRKSSPSKYEALRTPSSPVKTLASLTIGDSNSILLPPSPSFAAPPKFSNPPSARSSISGASHRANSAESTVLHFSYPSTDSLLNAPLGTPKPERTASGSSSTGSVSEQESLESTRETSTPVGVKETSESGASIVSSVKSKISSFNDLESVVTDNTETPSINPYERFDKELKQRRLKKYIEITKKENFSNVGFSGIETSSKASKVAKLAALYEERLQGLQVMSEIRKNK